MTDQRPRIGLIGVNLDPNGPALRSVQVNQTSVLAAYDPARLPRDIAVAYLHVHYGDFTEVDPADTFIEPGAGE